MHNNKIKVIIAVVLVNLLCASAWVMDELPAIRQPHDELFLRTNEALRSIQGFKPTMVYKFQDEYLHSPDGANLYTFGLMTGREARITLHDSSGVQPDLVFTLNEKYRKENICSVEYKEESESSYFWDNCYLDLVKDETAWFTLYAEKDYIALYQNGAEDPVMDLSSSDVNGKVNFNSYDSYSLSSEKQAIWDFQGHTLKLEDLYESEIVPAIKPALKRVKKQLLEIDKQIWRCEAAKVKKSESDDRNYRRRLYRFMQRYCQTITLQPYFDSVNRLETILLANGMEPPESKDYRVASFFKKR